MMMRDNPCFRCERRTAECHGTCEEYAKAKAKHEQIVKESRKEKGIIEFEIDRMLKTRRKKR